MSRIRFIESWSRSALLTASILVLSGAGCATRPPDQSSTQSGAALAISIAPNPIIASHVEGNRYDFPFDLIIREVGGAAVDIDEVAVEVMTLGGLRIYNARYDKTEITKLGYPLHVAAGETLRYHFNPRKDIPDPRLFSDVSATLTVTGIDAEGQTTTAQTTVTVR